MESSYKKVLDRVVGKNNYDIVNNCLYLHYEQITLRDTKGKKTYLEDVYVRLHFYHEGFSSSMSIAITTVSESHWRAGHYHAHGGGVGHFQGVCLGTGPLVGLLPYGLKDIERFEATLYAVKAYLEFENMSWLADRMYSGMKVRIGRLSKPDEVAGSERIIKAILKDENLIKELSFYVNDGGIEVKASENLEYLLGKFEQQETVKIGGEYCRLQPSSSPLNYNNSQGKECFTFNGKLVKLKIKPDTNEKKRVIHPQILKRALGTLGEKISRFAARSRTQLQSTGDVIKEVDKQRVVLMQKSST